MAGLLLYALETNYNRIKKIKLPTSQTTMCVDYGSLSLQSKTKATDFTII